MGREKKCDLKTGIKRKKNSEFEGGGGGVTKITFKFVTMQTSYQNAKNHAAFLTFKKFKYSRESMPPDTPPYYY